jgi:hypothetical protein
MNRSHSCHRHMAPRRRVRIRFVGQSIRPCRRTDFLGRSSQTIRSSKPPASSKSVAFSWLNSPVQNKIETRRLSGSRNSTTRPVMCNRNGHVFFRNRNVFSQRTVRNMWYGFLMRNRDAVGKVCARDSTANVNSVDFAVYATNTFVAATDLAHPANSRG